MPMRKVLSAQQELSGMGSMKKGGVFITGEFTVSPVPRAPASPWDRKRAQTTILPQFVSILCILPYALAPRLRLRV